MDALDLFGVYEIQFYGVIVQFFMIVLMRSVRLHAAYAVKGMRQEVYGTFETTFWNIQSRDILIVDSEKTLTIYMCI